MLGSILLFHVNSQSGAGCICLGTQRSQQAAAESKSLSPGHERYVHDPDLVGPPCDEQAPARLGIGKDHVVRRGVVMLPVVPVLSSELAGEKRQSLRIGPWNGRELVSA